MKVFNSYWSDSLFYLCTWYLKPNQRWCTQFGSYIWHHTFLHHENRLHSIHNHHCSLRNGLIKIYRRRYSCILFHSDMSHLHKQDCMDNRYWHSLFYSCISLHLLSEHVNKLHSYRNHRFALGSYLEWSFFLFKSSSFPSNSIYLCKWLWKKNPCL